MRSIYIFISYIMTRGAMYWLPSWSVMEYRIYYRERSKVVGTLLAR